MIEVVNTTAFQIAWIAGKKEHPQDSLSLIVKGTFQLNPGDKAIEIAESLPVTGDEFVDYDPKKELLYDSDFAYFKENTDLLLKGSCHTPEAKALRTCDVTFSVAGTQKTLKVHGPRYATPSLLGESSSEAEPFITMPLSYENAYGGEGYTKNPMGKGRDKDINGIKWLPNIIDPKLGEKEPAGFGPIYRGWEQRASKMGSYKGDYLEKRWPWFPEDFDWSYFNAAPEGMQYDGYLQGNESLYLKNLHPSISQYRAQLPNVKPRCFLHEPDGDEEFREVDMNLDTLWIDMDKEQLVLVWRGITEIQTPNYEEFSHVYLAKEDMEGESLAKDDHFENYQALAFPVVITSVGVEKSMPVEQEAPATEQQKSEESDDRHEKEMEAAIEDSREMMRKAGQDPSIIDDIFAAEDPTAVVATFLASLGLSQDQADEQMKESQEKMKEQLQQQGMSDEEIALLFDEG